MSQLMDRYADPEEAIAALNRARHLKVFAAIAGLVIGVGAAIGITALIYADQPASAPPIHATP